MARPLGLRLPCQPTGWCTTGLLCGVQSMPVGSSTPSTDAANNGDADPSAATVVATFGTMTAAGQEDIRGTNLKQLVRYQYEVSGAGDFRHAQFDVPEPSWEAN